MLHCVDLVAAPDFSCAAQTVQPYFAGDFYGAYSGANLATDPFLALVNGSSGLAPGTALTGLVSRTSGGLVRTVLRCSFAILWTKPLPPTTSGDPLPASNPQVPQRVVCTGYSNGGAYAELCGIWAAIQWPAAPVHVIVWGAPVVCFCVGAVNCLAEGQCVL